MEITKILLAAQSGDNNLRSQAEQQLKAAEQNNLPMYVLSLAGELAGNDKPVQSRVLAGLQIKNIFTAKDADKQKECDEKWRSLDIAIKTQVKSVAAGVLGSPVVDVRHVAAQLTSRIALIELPVGQWPDVIHSLCTTNMTPGNDALRQATLQTLGYICEEIDYKHIVDNANEILTAVVQCALPEEPNNEIKFVALRALSSSLSFVHDNFDRENERNYIMRVILESTRGPLEKIRELAFECCVQVATLYYDKIAPYMQGIFNMSLAAIKSEPEKVALQALEFWSTLAESEAYLIEAAEEAAAIGEKPEQQCCNFVLGALPYLVEALTTTLVKQEEDQDEDAWNISTAGGTCLALVATCARDKLVPVIMPFITSNITSAEWRHREAATLAFGSVLEGPQQLNQYIDGALPLLIEHLKDPNEMVKDTTAWTIGRVFQLHHTSVGNHLQPLVVSLYQGLSDTPKVAANVCWAIHCMAEAYESEEKGTGSTPLSPYFQYVVQALLNTTERTDADEDKLRSSAYAALNSLVHSAPRDCVGYVQHLLPVFMERLRKTVSPGGGQSSSELQELEESQALLCGVLQECTHKLGREGVNKDNTCDQMMMLYLQVLSTRGGPSVHEEALMAVGALALALEEAFDKYMSHFMPHLLQGLRMSQEYEVCAIAVGVMGDVARAVGSLFAPQCPAVMTVLMAGLQDPTLERSVKAGILGAFGDIAMAITKDFVPYVNACVSMLQQAGQAKLEDPDDEDEVEYINQLREGVCEGYTGIIQGLRAGNQAMQLGPHVPAVLSFVGQVFQDTSRTEGLTRGLVGLLGDLAHSMGEAVKPYLGTPQVRQLLDDVVKSNYTNQTIEVAMWAKELISAL